MLSFISNFSVIGAWKTDFTLFKSFARSSSFIFSLLSFFYSLLLQIFFFFKDMKNRRKKEEMKLSCYVTNKLDYQITEHFTFFLFPLSTCFWLENLNISFKISQFVLSSTHTFLCFEKSVRLSFNVYLFLL